MPFMPLPDRVIVAAGPYSGRASTHLSLLDDARSLCLLGPYYLTDNVFLYCLHRHVKCVRASFAYLVSRTGGGSIMGRYE